MPPGADDTPTLTNCDDTTKAIYLVARGIGAESASQCPKEYTEFTYQIGSQTDSKSTFCLMPMMTAGKCYASVDQPGKDLGYTPVACNNTGAEFKVTKIPPNVANVDKCTTPKNIVYTLKPTHTYCIDKAS